MKLRYQHLISTLKPESLANVPFHQSVQGIERWKSAGSPVHLAVHKIDANRVADTEYVKPHVHDADEINILIGDGLLYRVQLGEEFHEVESPASIWIPRGLLHAANHVKGAGHYVCIILTPPEADVS
jgi:quercetin dioxygenase-like cupin family protein